MLKSKIHRATVTEANKDYHGSLSLDATLIKKANLIPFERISVYNITNGNRFDTYVIAGEAGSGTICVNGAAAHLAGPGDKLIIVSYTWLTEDECQSHQPDIVFVDSDNKILATDQEI
jgi:aspartate 1-decarboxylase